MVDNHACIVSNDGYFVTFVALDSGGNPYFRPLSDGERLIHTAPPPGIENPRWDGENSAWTGESMKPPEPSNEEKIMHYTRELEATDYMVIKAGEYQLAGLPPPYEITQLHEKREQLRKQIRELNEKERNNLT
jgi:hypothetical protein